MTKEDYVSLEVAKKLQEKGYREPCFATYTMSFKDEFTLCIGTWEEIEFEYLSLIPSKGIQLQYLAPTLYEASKWLMDKGFCVSVSVYSKFVWGYTIYTFDEYNCINVNYNEEEYTSYEQALNAGILEALKLI